jgi:uncharacterized protein involved in outer membrane biogenesis
MRKLIGLLLVLIALVGVLVAVAASNLNAYLNHNKTFLAEQIEASLARPVQFDAVELSLRPGLTVEITGLRVGEDEHFGEGDFLSVGSIYVRVALWPALFGRLEVRKISLRDVSLTLIQSDLGFSIDSLGASPESPVADQVAKQPEASGSAAGSVASAIAEIRSGRIRYVDRTGETDRELVIDQLEFSTTELALTRPIHFQLVGEMLGAGDVNLSIGGAIGPIPTADGSTGDETPIDLSFSLEPVETMALKTLPGLAEAIDPELSLAGTLKLSGSIVGSVENPNLKFELDATDVLGSVLHARGSLSNPADPTADVTIEVFGGRIEIDGGWASNGRLELDVVVSDLELGELVGSLAQSDANLLDGRLSMNLAVTGTGTTWSEIEPGLEGLGTVRIDSGILHDINLIEEAIAGLTGLPGLSEQLPEMIRKKYPELFSTGDTEFDRMDAKLEVREGRVQILGLNLDARDFGLRGWGSLSLAGALDLSTRLAISSALSSLLIERAKPLKYLRDDAGRIEIPIRIRGTFPDVSAKPDTAAIAKKLAAGAAENLAEKSFKKLRKKRHKKAAGAASFDAGRNLLEKLLR